MLSVFWVGAIHAAPSSSLPSDVPDIVRSKPGESTQPPKKPGAPETPGATIIWLKPNVKIEIRADGSVWWYGVNQKKAILPDGTHAIKDGGTLTTKGGKLVSPKRLLPKPVTPEKEEKKPAV